MILLHGRVWERRSDIEEDAFLKTQNQTEPPSRAHLQSSSVHSGPVTTGLVPLTISPCVDTSPDRRGFAQFPTDHIMTHFTLLE